MSPNVLDNLSPTALDFLGKRAAARNKSLAEEVVSVLEEVVRRERHMSAPLPELIPHEEISAPFDIPLPASATTVDAIWGKPPLPDPIFLEDE